MHWIACGDGYIEADVIRWREGIWDRRGPKNGRSIKIGDREVIAEVLSGPDEDGWVVLLVRSCVLLPGKDGHLPKTGLLRAKDEMKRKHPTIVRGGVERMAWTDEGARVELRGSMFMRKPPVSSTSKRKRDGQEN